MVAWEFHVLSTSGDHTPKNTTFVVLLHGHGELLKTLCFAHAGEHGTTKAQIPIPQTLLSSPLFEKHSTYLRGTRPQLGTL